MSRRHRLAVVALILLSLPVWGPLCAMACTPANVEVSAHHGAGEACDVPADEAASGPLLAETAALGDCARHAPAPHVSTAPERSGVTGKPILAAIGAVHGLAAPRHDGGATIALTAPAGSDPPTGSLVVLRI